jgi:DNA-binding XRE family transcriptional regulator
MPKSSVVAVSLPAPAAAALRQLGEDLAIARKRRKESQRDWAARIGVSPPTLIRMERGDPGVSMAVYATALWLMGRSKALGEVAAPATDLLALESEVRAARARSVRTPASVSARLGQTPAAPPVAVKRPAPAGKRSRDRGTK